MAKLTTLKNEALTVMVSDLGAETQSITDAGGQEYLWQGDPAFWTGRAPLLFPIVGGSPDDRIAVGTFETDMPRHGFARRSHFELIHADSTSCTHVLRSNPEIATLYPFEFELLITHRLLTDGLRVEALVRNIGGKTMPFGFGFHPAFSWPLPGAADSDHFVQLDDRSEPMMARLNTNALLPPDRLKSPFSQGELTLDHGMFVEDAMIFPEGGGTQLRYGAKNGPQLQLTFEGLPHLAIWSKVDAPYICIEPWHGMAARSDASHQMSERPGNINLPPNETRHFNYSIQILS